MITPRSAAGLLAACLAAAAAAAPGPAQRRMDLIRLARQGADAAPALAQGLNDENAVVRRTAARLLARLGAPAQAALARAMKDSDPLVRRIAVRALAQGADARALPVLAAALKDADPQVRQAAVEAIITIQPRSAQAVQLLRLAAKDPAPGVRIPAVRALWPFRRKRPALRERADFDHDLKLVKSIRLPKDGWRFHLDPQRDGHEKKWYAPEFDDSNWKLIAIEQAWQKAGYRYIGVAWYRRWVTLPPKPAKVTAAELRFEGVDECAWVWVNGVYVGDHDLGPVGWNLPFRLDVTEEIKWGEKNLVVVRAMNTAHAGGVWRPVFLDVFE